MIGQMKGNFMPRKKVNWSKVVKPRFQGQTEQNVFPRCSSAICYIFRQVIGIPMGTNSGPQIANVYLHVYEYDYIQSLIVLSDEDYLRKLENIYRFKMIAFHSMIMVC